MNLLTRFYYDESRQFGQNNKVTKIREAQKLSHRLIYVTQIKKYLKCPKPLSPHLIISLSYIIYAKNHWQIFLFFSKFFLGNGPRDFDMPYMKPSLNKRCESHQNHFYFLDAKTVKAGKVKKVLGKIYNAFVFQILNSSTFLRSFASHSFLGYRTIREYNFDLISNIELYCSSNSKRSYQFLSIL